MAYKPKTPAQLLTQAGLGRMGGAASMGSKPNVMKSPGSGFAAMENTLLKGAAPDPKSLSGGGSGRQFFTQAAGGDLGGGLAKSPKVFNIKKPKAI